MKFDMCFKNIKNMQFNGQIFKICSHVNLFSESCNLGLVTTKFVTKFCPQTLSLNFGSLNNILGP